MNKRRRDQRTTENKRIYSNATTSLSGVRAFFVSPTITFHASLWAVPNPPRRAPPPYSARPHIDTICSWKISIRFTRWRTVASEIKGIVDIFRVSLVSRRCQGICPSLVPCSRLWFHKRNFVLGLLSTRRLSFSALSSSSVVENWLTVWKLRVHCVAFYGTLRRCDVSFRLVIMNYFGNVWMFTSIYDTF